MSKSKRRREEDRKREKRAEARRREQKRRREKEKGRIPTRSGPYLVLPPPNLQAHGSLDCHITKLKLIFNFAIIIYYCVTNLEVPGNQNEASPL